MLIGVLHTYVRLSPKIAVARRLVGRLSHGTPRVTSQGEEQLINHRLTSIGEQTIGIKVNSKKGSYITFATVDIKQLVRPTSVETKRVSALTVKGGGVAA